MFCCNLYFYNLRKHAFINAVIEGNRRAESDVLCSSLWRPRWTLREWCAFNVSRKCCEDMFFSVDRQTKHMEISYWYYCLKFLSNFWFTIEWLEIRVIKWNTTVSKQTSNHEKNDLQTKLFGLKKFRIANTCDCDRSLSCGISMGGGPEIAGFSELHVYKRKLEVREEKCYQEAAVKLEYPWLVSLFEISVAGSEIISKKASLKYGSVDRVSELLQFSVTSKPSIQNQGGVIVKLRNCFYSMFLNF